MKALPWIIVILVIAVLFYIVNQNSKIKTSLTGTAPNPYLPTNPSGYALGLTLANLLSNTKCGKDGNPPCTIKDLQDAGWSPEQIQSAQAGSNTVTQTYLCVTFGIGCK